MRKQKDDTEISTPVTCEDHEEVIVTEPSINDISLKYNKSPEIFLKQQLEVSHMRRMHFPRAN